MLEMPTIDKTEEWEDRLDQGQGAVKFPVTLFDQLEVIDTNFEFPEVKVNTPKLKKNSMKEINLGKKPKNKGKELF